MVVKGRGFPNLPYNSLVKVMGFSKTRTWPLEIFLGEYGGQDTWHLRRGEAVFHRFFDFQKLFGIEGFQKRFDTKPLFLVKLLRPHMTWAPKRVAFWVRKIPGYFTFFQLGELF